jgi:hypothetical protein
MPAMKNTAPAPREGTALRQPWCRAIVVSLIVVLMAVVALRVMGRRWWCKCVTPHVFVTGIWSAHNSQHLLDPYTFSHVQHGLLLYALFVVIAPRCSQEFRAVASISIECAWEVLENTNWVIERYRESTVALEYSGDSIVNSVADIAACALGYGMAVSVPVLAAVVCFAAIEGVMILWIRDSLLLNVLMLFHPIESIKHWQLDSLQAAESEAIGC